MSRTPRAGPRPDGGGAASAPTSRSPSGPPSRVGARPRQARVRPPSRPPPSGWSTSRRQGGLKQTSLELLQQVGLQNGGACPVPASQIAQSLRTLGVVARQQTFHPALRKGHRGRDLGNLVAFGQKPDGLKVPRRSHVRAGPVLLLQS